MADMSGQVWADMARALIGMGRVLWMYWMKLRGYVGP